MDGQTCRPRDLVALGAGTCVLSAVSVWLLSRAPFASGALVPEGSAADDGLAVKVKMVLQLLRERRPLELPAGVPAGAHELPPKLPRAMWEELGCLLRHREQGSPNGGPLIPGHRWISLRLDGCGFSKQVRQLRRLGVLTEGFCPAFGEIMKDCTLALMESLHACAGYTQSDEITLILHSTRVIRGEQQVHLYGGRVQKLCSIAASTATAVFNNRLVKLAAVSGGAAAAGNAQLPLALFDCRVGTFDSEDEALSLLFWRAQDCGINGVSDAVHHLSGSDKQMKGSNTGQKLAWLATQGQLPLHPHQAHGSLFLRRHRIVQCQDPRTWQIREAFRRHVEQIGVGRCIIGLFAEGSLRLDDPEDAKHNSGAVMDKSV